MSLTGGLKKIRVPLSDMGFALIHRDFRQILRPNLKNDDEEIKP